MFQKNIVVLCHAVQFPFNECVVLLSKVFCSVMREMQADCDTLPTLSSHLTACDLSKMLTPT